MGDRLGLDCVSEQGEIHVIFKNGIKLEFSIPDFDHFQKLVDELARIWGVWLYVGKHVVIRKKEVLSIIFISKSREKLYGCEN